MVNTSVFTILVAGGLFLRGDWFLVLSESGIRQLEELFRTRTIEFALKLIAECGSPNKSAEVRAGLLL